MVTTWGHDPHFIPIENLLTIINDTLRESPVLIQVIKNKFIYTYKISINIMFTGMQSKNMRIKISKNRLYTKW